MGAAACSGKAKTKQEKPNNDIQVIQVVEISVKANDVQEEHKVMTHNKIKHKTLSPNEVVSDLENPLENKTINLLAVSKKFSGLLDLLGSLDQLPSSTKDKLNKLIILRSNISITTQNTLKRALRDEQILRKPSIDDESYLYSDVKFSQTFSVQMKQVNEVIGSLEKDEQFEEAFPILCWAFIDLRNSIIAIQREYDLTVQQSCDEIPAKGMDLKKASFESQIIKRRTTTNLKQSPQ